MPLSSRINKIHLHQRQQALGPIADLGWVLRELQRVTTGV